MAMTEEELAQLEKLVNQAVKGVEEKLAAKVAEMMGGVNEVIGGLNSKIEEGAATANELQEKAKMAFEGLPLLIKEHFETQVQTNLPAMVEQLGNQFMEKMKVAAGSAGAPGDGAFGIRDLLSQSDKIIGVINAWKQPTTDQAMMGQMNFVMKWHSLLTKFERGGGTTDELTQRISETFTPTTKEE